MNHKLEYCAIVVDEIEPTKDILENVGLSQVPLYPIDNIKECIEKLQYDYILCVQGWGGMKLATSVRKYASPATKVLCFSGLVENYNFLLERSRRYFKEHAAEFEIFSTGISNVATGIEPSQFERKLFNFGRGSQDLYYNFQIAKTVISYGGAY